MSALRMKRLAAAALVTGGLAVGGLGGTAIASKGSSAGPPGQSAAPAASAPASGSRALPPGTCSGGTTNRTLVKTVNNAPITWQTGERIVEQQITTTAAQQTEMLTITFSGEAWASPTLAWIQAGIEVDGVSLEDVTNPNAFKSGATYTDSSFTRCVRVPPGKHKVVVRLKTVGTGDAWVDDYALQITQSA